MTPQGTTARQLRHLLVATGKRHWTDEKEKRCYTAKILNPTKDIFFLIKTDHFDFIFDYKIY